MDLESSNDHKQPNQNKNNHVQPPHSGDPIPQDLNIVSMRSTGAMFRYPLKG